MDNVYEVSMLMDFYGQLITKRQYEVLDLHYNNDYSLGEIAQYLNISRQGVYDNVKRGRKLLCTYESKLGLLKRFLEHREKAERALKELENIQTQELLPKDRERLKRVKDIIGGLTEIL